MVKTYLKYQIKDVIGQISGKSCCIATSKDGKILYTGCNEFLLIIDIKTGEVIKKIPNQAKSILTCIRLDQAGSSLAAGYENGTVIIYSTEEDYSIAKQFSLHKSAITSLEFNKNILASGSKDTNILIWDLIAETVLYKLSGHKDSIYKLSFFCLKFQNYDEVDVLLSASKDNTIKLWNIKTQETLQTIADLIHKVTDFIICDGLLLVGSYDQKIRLYTIQQKESLSSGNFLVLKGNIVRQSNSKILSIQMYGDKLLSIQGNDNTIEFVKILNKSELKSRMIKNELDKDKSNKREKLIVNEKYNAISEKVKASIEADEYNYKFKFYSLFKFIAESKIISHAFIPQNNSSSKHVFKFCLGLGNNSVEIYELDTLLVEHNIFALNKEKDSDRLINEKKADESNLAVKKSLSLDSFGHRDILRFVKFSEKDKLVLTCSNDSIRLWNSITLQFNKSLDIKNIISAAFVLEDKYIALGSKTGSLYLIHTASFQIKQEIETAHMGEVWSLQALRYSYVNNSYKILTCSSDKTIKYWNLLDNTLSEYKSLEAVDQLTQAMISPDGKYLIYSLLDNSIRIFYEDTNKFFLNLHGHKLPVLSFDISSDGALLVSGSADKNVKLWGMDFGDCHKSFFAHQDSVTTVKFVKKTHYFFSSGKDKCIRYWDADTFELIMEFAEFFAEVWSFDINTPGTSLIAVSADCSIRVLELGKEQVIPDWEREKKLDQNIEEDLQKTFDMPNVNANALNKDIEKLIPIKKSMDNIGYAEDLMDSLDVAEKFKGEVYNYEIDREEYEKNLTVIAKKDKKKNKEAIEVPEIPNPSPFLLGKNIFDFILFKLKAIRFSDLESTLNNLPYSYVQILFFYLEYYIRQNIEIELNARCVLFLTALFETQLSNDKTMIRLLQSIRVNLKKNLKLKKELLSFNIQGVDFIMRSFNLKEKTIEEFKNSYKQSELI